MKINIEGFKCDVCGNEYLKNVYNSDPLSFSIDIRSNKGGISDVHNSSWDDICHECKDKIINAIHIIAMEVENNEKI